MAKNGKLLDIAPGYPECAQPLFKSEAELDEFWQEFYSKVKPELEEWEIARARSEEDARHLWLRRHPAGFSHSRK